MVTYQKKRLPAVTNFSQVTKKQLAKKDVARFT